MKTQTFKLNGTQIHELDIIFLAFKNELHVDASKCIDFVNNTLSVDDDILAIIVGILSSHTCPDNTETKFTELYNGILDAFTKQDRNNVIQPIIPHGMEQIMI